MRDNQFWGWADKQPGSPEDSNATEHKPSFTGLVDRLALQLAERSWLHRMAEAERRIAALRRGIIVVLFMLLIIFAVEIVQIVAWSKS